MEWVDAVLIIFRVNHQSITNFLKFSISWSSRSYLWSLIMKYRVLDKHAHNTIFQLPLWSSYEHWTVWIFYCWPLPQIYKRKFLKIHIFAKFQIKENSGISEVRYSLNFLSELTGQGRARATAVSHFEQSPDNWHQSCPINVQCLEDIFMCLKETIKEVLSAQYFLWTKIHFDIFSC